VVSEHRPGKSIIVAVGRSGTTILHRLLLEIYADQFGQDFDCLYEPFVWDSAAIGHYPKDKGREAQFGRRDAISEEGLHLHTRTPLFGDNDLPLDDQLARYLKAGASPLLAKFIRANGRLSLLDRLYPDGRFVLMVRNPFDVVNSVLTKFSFFGAEFHHNDYPRFASDVARLFGVKLPAEHEIPIAYKQALWCHFMNLHALRHAQGKANYKIIVYEDFSRNREAYARAVCDHVGAPYSENYGVLLGTNVGRVTHGAHALSRGDAEMLAPLLESYAQMVAALPQMTPFDPATVHKKYAPSKLRAVPAEPRGLGWSPNKLESELIRRDQSIQEAATTQRTRIADVQRQTLHADMPGAVINVPVSVIVTSYNNASTLRRAIDSVRRQTYPVAEILVADDGSTDDSRALLETLAKEDQRVRPLLRDNNMGVSANRNDAIRQARHAFVSHVDGDDEFHPEKIEREVRALQGRADSVAFSDTIRIGPDSYWDCSWMAGLSGRAAVAGMVSRRAPLPRDMLMSSALFFAAGGFNETISIYEDWGFKIRLADKAKHWLYSGRPGTIYRPGGLSQAGHAKHVHGGLWILCNDAANVIAARRCNGAAFAGLLKLMKIEADPDLLATEPFEDSLGPKISIVFDQIRMSLLEKPATAYTTAQEFFDPLNRLVSTVGMAIGAAR
jgi:glycosyltransferase involved in cell wall biosynthesis